MSLPSPMALAVIGVAVLLHGLMLIMLADMLLRCAGKPSLWPVVRHNLRRALPYAVLVAALLCVPPAWSFILGSLAWIIGNHQS